jgi:hypothetical protein
MRTLTEDDAKRLSGRIELMADRLYPRGSAISRANNPPDGMLDGGEPLLISVKTKSNNSNRRVTRYLAAWHIKERSTA